MSKELKSALFVAGSYSFLIFIATYPVKNDPSFSLLLWLFSFNVILAVYALYKAVRAAWN